MHSKRLRSKSLVLITVLLAAPLLARAESARPVDAPLRTARLLPTTSQRPPVDRGMRSPLMFAGGAVLFVLGSLAVLPTMIGALAAADHSGPGYLVLIPVAVLLPLLVPGTLLMIFGGRSAEAPPPEPREPIVMPL
ncbi:MAG: hypothetical protein K1X89_08840 [Myxococcaceae bacterium]|nr:hypothetical protein [Myxococcaceae bacterium]